MDLGQLGETSAARLYGRTIVDPCDRLCGGQAGPHEPPGHHGASHILHDLAKPAAGYDRQGQTPFTVAVKHRLNHGVELFLDQIKLGLADIDHHASGGTMAGHVADPSHAPLQPIEVDRPRKIPSHNALVVVETVFTLLVCHSVALHDPFWQATTTDTPPRSMAHEPERPQ